MDRGWEGNGHGKEYPEQCRSGLMIPNEAVEMGYEGSAGCTVVVH